MTDNQKLWDKMKLQDEKLAKQVYVSEGFLTIDVEYEYNIEIARCNTPEKILAWVLHLSEKTWMTVEIMERFVQTALREAGLAIPSV